MGFWDFFKSKKNNESKSDESSLPNIGSNDLVFAKNFTDSGGRFIFIDEINSTKEVFEKIFEENQWDAENVCSLNPNVAKNLEIRSIRKVDNENVKALVTECEFLISNTGRILICNKQIKSNKIEDLPSVLIVLAKSNQFVSDVSEGMTMLKNKYKGNFPTNITTLNVKNKTILEKLISRLKKINGIEKVLRE